MNITSTLAMDVKLNTHLVDLSVLLNVILKQCKLSNKFLTNAVSLLELCVSEKGCFNASEELIDPVEDSDGELSSDDERLAFEAVSVVEEVRVDSDDESHAVGEMVIDDESISVANEAVVFDDISSAGAGEEVLEIEINATAVADEEVLESENNSTAAAEEEVLIIDVESTKKMEEERQT